MLSSQILVFCFATNTLFNCLAASNWLAVACHEELVLGKTVAFVLSVEGHSI